LCKCWFHIALLYHFGAAEIHVATKVLGSKFY
jgi:hypothetical protein